MGLQALKAQLGTPYYETTNCLIYCGDCLELFEHILQPSIDLTVTSPPYNIGKSYETVLDLDDYLEWCEIWIRSLHRVTVPNGSLWLNLGYLSIQGKAKAIPISYLLWDKISFFLMQEVVWHYEAGVAGKKFFSPRNEKFLWYVKNPDCYTFNLDHVRDPNVKYPNQKKNGKIKVNPLGKNPGDVWSFAKVTTGKNRASKERTSHPAQFPEKVIERIIKASSNEGDIILDPFMGSGTSLVVGLKEKRQVIGFEIKQDYCDLAIERIERLTQTQHPLLFTEW